jgi:1-acyl-sn-glycerol-3-phosphate acyltransferase
LRAGRDGAALLAIRAGVPLLPVGIIGSGNLFPKGTWFPHRSHVTVRIGPAFSLPAQPHGRVDRRLLAHGTDRIMREIAALLPESRRGHYRQADDSVRAAT